MKFSVLLAGAAFALAGTAIAYAAGGDPLAPIGAPPPPKPAPVMPVTDTLYGQKVTDNYRYMEKLGADTIAWIKAEDAYTRKVMDAISGRAALEKRVAAFTGSFGFIKGYVSYGGRAFYQERAPGADQFDLMVKDDKGTRKLIDIAQVMKAHGGKPYAINWFLASPDGSKVAVGISAGGSEDAAMTVYDAVSGKEIAGPVDRARFGATAWVPASNALFFLRLKKMAPGESDLTKYDDVTAQYWDLKSAPKPVAGHNVSKNATFNAHTYPAIVLTSGSDTAVMIGINGVQNEVQVWIAPAAQANDVAAPWKPLADFSDGITNADMQGDTIYLLSHKDALTFKVLALKAGEPLSSAKTVVPANPSRVIDEIHAAADGLYVLAHEGAYSVLYRLPEGASNLEEIALPTKGHIAEAFTDQRKPGITFDYSSWVVPPTELSYDPTSGAFTDLHIGTKGNIDTANYTVSDLQAKAHDGMMVPLSLVQPKAEKTPGIAIVEAYGSYGISNLADFSLRRAAVMKENIAYGICHVRGGGELGETWRLGGKDANKHNTWQDLIACGEDLIARGITTKDKLFIIGGSAGGITMGRAITERPDLFAGVIDIVPVANTLRAEFSPNGPPNVPEFGSVKTKQGFLNLYDMDSIQHVKKGAVYPAVMIYTGLNDPRVSSWEPAKFATVLIASGTPNPVLLRIDTEAGHGIGSTKSQTDKLTTDYIAFMKWRAVVQGWRPDLSKH